MCPCHLRLTAACVPRSETYAQVVEEADVYEDVDEEAYQELVRKRREDNFIEDDDGGG